jgi:inorganic pyrophosphatase
MPESFNPWKPHPWHGLDPGPNPPELLNAIIEITPFDGLKYEVDKTTGYLRVDRPQTGSALPPTAYGFIPRTLAGDRVGRLMPDSRGGDGDPLDITVISERPVTRAEVLLHARVLGGIPMLDHGLADDKIVAVLKGDQLYGHMRNLEELPDAVVDRLVHYFSTYKLKIGEPKGAVEVGTPYGFDHASKVVLSAIQDYVDHFMT